MLVENRPVRKVPFIEPRLKKVHLRALRRLLSRQRTQIVDSAQKALQPNVSSLRRPRDNDPHLSKLLVSSCSSPYWMSHRRFRNPRCDYVSMAPVEASEYAGCRSGDCGV